MPCPVEDLEKCTEEEKEEIIEKVGEALKETFDELEKLKPTKGDAKKGRTERPSQRMGKPRSPRRGKLRMSPSRTWKPPRLLKGAPNTFIPMASLDAITQKTILQNIKIFE